MSSPNFRRSKMNETSAGQGLDGTMARRLRSQRMRMTSRFRRAVRFSGERPAERQALTGASSSVV